MKNNRRRFIKNITLGSIGATMLPEILLGADKQPMVAEADFKSDDKQSTVKPTHKYNSVYEDDFLNRIAFPIGGIGAGMLCIGGNGAITHMSVRNNPEMFNEPEMFAAISLKGQTDSALIIEGPVQEWKKFGQPGSALGGGYNTWGLPRFEEANFRTKFPFAEINLADKEFPAKVKINAWSPFTPTDEDSSSMPVGGMEYTFKNTGNKTEEYIFSYNSRQFMAEPGAQNYIKSIPNGFALCSDGSKNEPEKQGAFAIFTNDAETIVDHSWFRGVRRDPLSMIWNVVKNGKIEKNAVVEHSAPGASLFVPFTLSPGQEKTICLMMAWYVPHTNLQMGNIDPSFKAKVAANPLLQNHKPWYSSKFKDINQVCSYWVKNYDEIKKRTSLFTKTFYDSTLPAEVIEAIAANLTILKSPTVLRQYDGRFWCWEGCGDSSGSCYGSCTHVWNYAQAVSHLFPALERSLRETEFGESQNAEGRQVFRTNLPITPAAAIIPAAADGQLGGIMKAYREWRISADSDWLKKMYPSIKKSLDYCIQTWDPTGKGLIEEPHHNTYDIEFWGATGFATSFYLGALNAMIQMGTHLNQDVSVYKKLYTAGKANMETKLYDGEYFIQTIQWKGLKAPDPTQNPDFTKKEYNNPESIGLLKTEGPKYQYGKGCLSDGVVGDWLSRMCGLNDVVDPEKVKSHVNAVYKYNFKTNLHKHGNPQRTTYAIGNEGGLLLCTWPKGGELSLPFHYSKEVWTGIEYQVASHLMLLGEVDKGLDIVRACRNRYDGKTRNPFNEYECGHWYARALASYGMLQALTGARYDALTQTLYINSRVGDFTSFLSTATGYGTVSLKNGKPTLQVAYGTIKLKKVMVSGKTVKFALT